MLRKISVELMPLLSTFLEPLFSIQNSVSLPLCEGKPPVTTCTWAPLTRDQSCGNHIWYKCIWVRSRNCGCLITWFCYQLIAKPGNKTATVSWPDPYVQNLIILWVYGQGFLYNIIYFPDMGKCVSASSVLFKMCYRSVQSKQSSAYNNYDI